MKNKSKLKGFIISVIGRDFRRTPEPEENRKEDLQESSDKTRRGDLPWSPSSGESNILKKDKTHYRIEFTKDGRKFWTLH